MLNIKDSMLGSLFFKPQVEHGEINGWNDRQYSAISQAGNIH